MLIEAITQALAGALLGVLPVAVDVLGGVRAAPIGDVCAKPPTGVEGYVNEVLGWVKYGVAALIIGCGFASVGAMIVGKIGSMGRAAQIGASGLFWTVIGAIAFVTIYGILTAIVGNGC